MTLARVACGYMLIGRIALGAGAGSVEVSHSGSDGSISALRLAAPGETTDSSQCGKGMSCKAPSTNRQARTNVIGQRENDNRPFKHATHAHKITSNAMPTE